MGIVGTLYPHLLVSPGMKFVDAAGRVLIDYSRSRELGPQGWHPSYRFHQPQLEETLRKRLVDHAHVAGALVLRAGLVDVFGYRGRAHEGNGMHIRMGQQLVHLILATVHDLQHVLWRAGFEENRLFVDNYTGVWRNRNLTISEGIKCIYGVVWRNTRR